MQSRAQLLSIFLLAAGTLLLATTRPPDMRFAVHTIDLGASETAAAVDVNRDGHLDIVSGEYWYEAPIWTPHRFRELNYTNNYIDNFCDLPIDVDGDGYPDIVSVSWFAKEIAWWKNPSKTSAEWKKSIIDSASPYEFALMVDLDNDGQARELLPEAGSTQTPMAWYEVRNGAWVKHVVSNQSYGHGIGAGDVNGDGRADILTPRGWFEAPADPRSGQWKPHLVWESLKEAGPGNVGRAAPASLATAPEQVQYAFMYVLDVNGDGRNDVITGMAHDYGVLWLEQGPDDTWTRHMIDTSWSQAHAPILVDLNGDGRLDFIAGKRYLAHNGNDPGEREPLGVYWYEYFKTADGRIDWVRHVIDYGGRIGAGIQLTAADINGDGDLDLICPGKSGLFLLENLIRDAEKPPSTNRSTNRR